MPGVCGRHRDPFLAAAYDNIRALAHRLLLPSSVLSPALKLYKEIQESETLCNRCLEGRAAACLYIVCRQRRVHITFKRVCEASKARKTHIVQCFKLIARHFNDKKAATTATTPRTSTPTTSTTTTVSTSSAPSAID